MGGPDSQRTRSKTQHGQVIGIVELVKCPKGPMAMCEPYGTSTPYNTLIRLRYGTVRPLRTDCTVTVKLELDKEQRGRLRRGI
jgi:hypothetical protein